MKKLEGIILEGEKIGIERYAGRDQKMKVNLHMLCGFDSVKVGVSDATLVKVLDDHPARKPIKLKATVLTYKDELYFSAVQLLQ